MSLSKYIKGCSKFTPLPCPILFPATSQRYMSRYSWFLEKDQPFLLLLLNTNIERWASRKRNSVPEIFFVLIDTRYFQIICQRRLVLDRYELLLDVCRGENSQEFWMLTETYPSANHLHMLQSYRIRKIIFSLEANLQIPLILNDIGSPGRIRDVCYSILVENQLLFLCKFAESSSLELHLVKFDILTAQLTSEVAGVCPEPSSGFKYGNKVFIVDKFLMTRALVLDIDCAQIEEVSLHAEDGRMPISHLPAFALNGSSLFVWGPSAPSRIWQLDLDTFVWHCTDFDINFPGNCELSELPHELSQQTLLTNDHQMLTLWKCCTMFCEMCRTPHIHGAKAWIEVPKLAEMAFETLIRWCPIVNSLTVEQQANIGIPRPFRAVTL